MKEYTSPRFTSANAKYQQYQNNYPYRTSNKKCLSPIMHGFFFSQDYEA